ncbi:MAG: Smr/MutS family protein [Moheibacter sp.]
MFKTGDKVRVLDDDQKGEVIRIHKNRITILNEFGFEETYNSTELIPDKGFEVETDIRLSDEMQPETAKSKEVSDSKEIDLHIGQLTDSYSNLTHFEMLQIQLDTVKEEMELAISQRRKKLIFIHGHGSGKLKEEMMKLLKKYRNIEIYDASFRKYKGGASCVEFKRF